MIELSAQDTATVNITWWQRRTRLEKKFVIGIVFVAGIILSFLIDAALHLQKQPPKTCNTDQCIISSASILNQIDETTDPCNDFFKFACGMAATRAHHKDIPTETLYHQVHKQQINILLEPVTKNDPPALKYEKQLFSSCVNEATNGTSNEVLKSILNDLGGLPVVIGEKWNGTNFNWVELTEKIKDIGLYYQTILQARLKEDSSQKLERNITVQSFMFTIADKHIHVFKKLIIDYTIALGAKEAIANQEVTEAFDFLIKLNKLRSLNKNETKPRLQISELQKKYKEINWLKYLKILLDPDNNITEQDYVIFPHTNFLTNLFELINATKKRTLANYLLCSATASVKTLLSNEVLELFNQYNCIKDNYLRERMEECKWAVTFTIYPNPSYFIYVNKFTPNSTRKKVLDMFNLITNEFIKLIRVNTWMDTDSKDKAVKWLQNITAVIGVKAGTLEKIYEKAHKPIDTHRAFLANYLKIQKERLIDNKGNKQTQIDFPLSLTLTQILFYKREKQIMIPTGILHGVYFEENRPMYMNYGTLGKYIASNLVFDYTYSAADSTYIDQLWSPDVQKMFENNSSCVSHNFEYIGDEGNLITSMRYYDKHHKIAQIMGMKLAYNAYKTWVNQYGEELNLVGLNYTKSQIFWMSALADVCYEESDETQNNFYSDSEIVRQNIDFAIDFHCGLDSKMNPSNKCVVF